MPLQPAITDLGQLKDSPAIAALQDASLVEGAKFDRDELTIYVNRANITQACEILRDGKETRFNFLSDITCVDVFPAEPRFEVLYHLLSHSQKDRVRLIARVPGGDPTIDSIMDVWPSVNFFEREVYDLFGVRFLGHPNLHRIMMPQDWKGHPLRKDYPVEGYR